METLLPFMVDREEYTTYVGGLRMSAQKTDVSVKAGCAKDIHGGGRLHFRLTTVLAFFSTTTINQIASAMKTTTTK